MLDARLFRCAAFLTGLFPALIVMGKAPSAFGVVAIALMFLAHSVLVKDWTWLRERYVQWILAAWGYCIVRACFAENPDLALRYAVPLIRYVMFAVALSYWLLRDTVTRTRCFYVLLVVLLFMTADGVLQWLLGRDVLGHYTVIQPDGNKRLTGPFNAPILGIMLAWLSLPVCVQLIMQPYQNGNRKAMLQGIAVSLLVLAMIALSGERTALILAIAGAALALLLSPVRKLNLLWFAVASAALLGVLALLSPMMFERQIVSTITTITHWQRSLYGLLLTSDIELAMQHPVWGIGMGHFRILCPSLYTGTAANLKDVCNTHPHNLYLEWWIENGAIGAALFLAFVVSVCVAVVKSWHVNKLNPLFIGLVVAMTMRLWPLIPTTNFLSAWGAPPYWFILGALMTFCIKDRDHAAHSVTL